MFRFDSLDDLKKSIYKWILPCLILALFFNLVLQSYGAGNMVDIIFNISLMIWFIISLIFLYKNRFIRFAEFTNLILISFYHTFTVYSVIINTLVKYGTGSLGDFIVWTPLYFIFIFITIGVKRGLYFSIGILLITLIPAIMYWDQFSSESIDSLSQFYFSNIVYILILYYAQHILKAYTEVELFKTYAYIDSLTRVANRHRIDEWLEKKLRGLNHKQNVFSVIFFDIDQFKNINDTYGHKIGDSVLQELAMLMSKSLSEGDQFGRWGGEEFIVITETNIHDAMLRAEHFRKRVEAYRFKGTGTITASFGVTEAKKTDTIDSLLNRADEALYLSKNTGRNIVSRK